MTLIVGIHMYIIHHITNIKKIIVTHIIFTKFFITIVHHSYIQHNKQHTEFTHSSTRVLPPGALRPKPAALKEFNGEIFALPSDPGMHGMDPWDLNEWNRTFVEHELFNRCGLTKKGTSEPETIDVPMKYDKYIQTMDFPVFFSENKTIN